MTILAILGYWFLASVVFGLLFGALCHFGSQHDDPDPNFEENVLLLSDENEKEIIIANY